MAKLHGKHQIEAGTITPDRLDPTQKIPLAHIEKGSDLVVSTPDGYDLDDQKIINLADGVNPSDAVNYGQLSGAIQGLNFKRPVRVATTETLGIKGTVSGTVCIQEDPSRPDLIVDGVSLSVGDRVLVKDHTDKTLNGIWDVFETASPWTLTRAQDFDEDADVSSGVPFVFVNEGTTNQGTAWNIFGTTTIVVGTTELEWSPFTTVSNTVAGSGLKKTGNVLSLNTDSSLVFTGDTAGVRDYTSLLKKIGDEVDVRTSMLKNLVPGTEIADAVTVGQLQTQLDTKLSLTKVVSKILDARNDDVPDIQALVDYVTEQIAQVATFVENDPGDPVPDGTQTVFTLRHIPIPDSLVVINGGVVLQPDNDYTIARNIVTFVYPPIPPYLRFQYRVQG